MVIAWKAPHHVIISESDFISMCMYLADNDILKPTNEDYCDAVEDWLMTLDDKNYYTFPCNKIDSIVKELKKYRED